MYRKTSSRVRVNDTFSDNFQFQVGLYQGSALRTLLFIIVLKALSREIRSGHWEGLLCADALTLFESLVGMKGKPKACKRALE